MAYPRPPPLEGRPPTDLASERPRSSWETRYHPVGPAMSNQHPPPLRPTGSTLPAIDSMDPESEDSDVSVTIAEHYTVTTPLAQPVPIPQAPSKHALESSDLIQARLRELSRVEDHNIKKQELLLAKRRRRDEKIQRRREIQDQKWAAILAARDRRDARIKARRDAEDAAFKRFDDQLEEQEASLRRRLKRLKRGLPADESPPPGTRSISSNSMSPPGPAYSTIPPPAKRHQSGPPGQQDGPPTPQARNAPNLPMHSQNGPPPPPPPPPAPQYSFYQANPQPYAPPYHQSPYSHTPMSGPSGTPNGPLGSNNTPGERSNTGMNGHPASPLNKPGQPSTPTHYLGPNSKSRPASSSYDTRPPPTTSSGFASINMPQSSGFAPINARAAATPPGVHQGPMNPDPNRTPNSAQGPDMGFAHRQVLPFASQTGIPYGPASTKRAPSTTHPYQMSEAFANRHHHCERVDSLNRGIWTSHGPGGSQEQPTGPPVEMYLRCNHDDCRRIDWRTVHGLQCHIVKNHEQPKGTIGSLEKALEKYGVPVKEVEEYEREHGEGTAGTMADPKNLKIKNKTREASSGKIPSRKGTPLSYDPNTRPAGFKPSPTATTASPTVPGSESRSPMINTPSGPPSAGGSVIPSSNGPQQPARPETTFTPTRFEVIMNDRPATTPTYQTPSKLNPEDKKLQGDVEMGEAPPLQTALVSKPPVDTNGIQKPFHTGFIVSTNPPPAPPAAREPIQTESSNPVMNGVSPIPATTAPKPQEKDQVPPPPQVISQPAPTSAEAPKMLHQAPSDTPMVNAKENTTSDALPSESIAPSVEKNDEPKVNGHVNGGPEKVPEIESEDKAQPATNEKAADVTDSTTAENADKESSVNATAPNVLIGRKSGLQSPVMNTKPFNPPGSVKRMSRRSSAARRTSVDEDTEATNAEPEKINDDDDGDSITVANTDTKKDELSARERERESAKTPPRRTAGGRFRKTRAG